MSFLLDTNAVSEWTKPRPDPGLVTWLATIDETRAFISVATLAELRDGVERLPNGARRNRLEAWLTGELPMRFKNRVLGVDAETADRWGRMTARARARGRPVEAIDALIAATAERHALAIVTRNASHFSSLGVRLLNPWRNG